MAPIKVVAVGAPDFRHEVAVALDMSPEAVAWYPSVTDLRDAADIIALSPSVGDEDALRFVEGTRRTNPLAAVILVRKGSQNGTLPALIRAGLRDVVDLSKSDRELSDALQRALDWSRSLKDAGDTKDDSTGGGKIVSVFSSKGGTGKSFLSSNLAAALADITEQDTGLIDLDLDMGDVFSYFGAEPARPVQDLINLRNPDEETIRVAATQLGSHLYGFGAPLDPGAETVGAEPMKRLLRGMKKTFEFIVLDASADYSDHVIGALDMSDAICLVSGLDVVGIKHLMKTRETLLRIGIPQERLRVVLNRADSKVSLEIHDVEKILGLRIDARIPSSRLVPNALNLGVPIYAKDPNSEVAQALRQLASGLAESFGVSTRLGGPRKKRHAFSRRG